MRIFIGIIFTLIGLSVYGQTHVSGIVTDKKNNPIPGVNVYIQGTFDGGTTAADGHFAFQTSKTQDLVIVASFIGYHEYTATLAQDLANIHIVLKEKVNQLTAVSITAGSIEVTDKAKAVVLKPLDILTTAGSMGNINGALVTLPGTAAVENDGRLFVRGGDATETAIFIDGLFVANPYGVTGYGFSTRNRFSPYLFKGSFFSSGGYSAEYGNALSSVLALETIDKPVRSQLNLNLSSVGVSAEGIAVGEKHALSASLDYTDLHPYQGVVKQNLDYDRAPHAAEAHLVYHHDWGKDGMVKAFFQTSAGGVALWQPQPGKEGRGNHVQIKNQYAFLNLSHKKPLNQKWFSEGGISLNEYKVFFDIDTLAYETHNRVAHVKQKFIRYFTDGFKIKGGGEAFLTYYAETFKNFNLERDIRPHHGAVFAEAEWNILTSFSLRGGVRGSFTTLDNRIEPRFAAAYRPYKKGNISIAIGSFSQMPQNEDLVQYDDLEQSRANHFQISFQHGDKNRLFKIEAYEKRYDRIPLRVNGSYLSAGTGEARGIDVFYRENKWIKNTEFWITYSYVHSRRSYDRYTTPVQPPYAPQHNFSAVAKYWLARLKSQVGATFLYNSGYPYDNPAQSERMASLTPVYASLALNWSYLLREHIILHAACTNVLGRNNIFGYHYAESPDSGGNYPRIPGLESAPRFYYVGVFYTLSKGNKANQLNQL